MQHTEHMHFLTRSYFINVGKQIIALLFVCRANMLFEITTAREGRFTVTATIRCVVRVNVKVKFQIRQFVECFVAQSAVVWLFSSVNKQVVAKIAFLMKSFTANVANKFLFLAVCSNVRL